MPKVLAKSRAITLLTLRAYVAYKRGENLPCSIKTEDMSYVTTYCYWKSGVKNYVREQTKLFNLSLKV